MIENNKNSYLTNFQVFPKFIFRSPLLTYVEVDELLKIKDKKEIIAAIKRFYKDPVIKLALYVSSINLYHLMETWLNSDILFDHKLNKSLLKYLLRMGTRSTPFGLFSGVSYGKLGSETNIILPSKELTKISVSLDMEYLYSIKENLLKEKEIKDNIKWYANPTLYQVGDSLKYIDYQYKGRERKFGLSVVNVTDHLQNVLEVSKKGVKIDEIAKILLQYDVDIDEACHFIDELIEKRILISELEPVLTNGYYFEHIKNTLYSISILNDTDIIKDFKEIDKKLEGLESCKAWNKENFESLKFTSIKPIFEPYMKFQLDSTKEPLNAEIDTQIIHDVENGINVLNKLNRNSDDSTINSFRKKFFERFEYEEIPLMQALDPEIGFNYFNPNVRDITPLVDNLNFTARNNNSKRQIDWLQRDTFLLKKILNARNSNSLHIDIKDEDIKDLKSNWDEVPDSFTVMISLNSLEKEGKHEEYINLIGGTGSTAINIFSRFTHIDQTLETISKDISEVEDKLNSDSIVAEFIYMPSHTRMGNIMQQSSKRKYYIPFTGGYPKNSDNLIYVDDLMLSIKDDKFIIRSKSLNKEIKIKSTNAYNFGFDTHPVFHFLGDLQYQNLKWPLVFDWGPLAFDYGFLPRVTYRNIILSPATWHLNQNDLQKFKISNKSISSEQIDNFKVTWSLPTRFLIAEHDNHLLIDLENELSIEMLKDILSKKNTLKVIEFLNPTNLVKNNKGESFFNEIGLLLTKKIENKTSINSSLSLGQEKKRKYITGEKWLFLKIYSGTKGADRILNDIIKNLVEKLLTEKLIKKWFFIRYADPDFHIRVRFYVENIKDNATIIELIKDKLAPFISNRIIHKVSYDTYNQELERYGFDSIDNTEDLFFIDSQITLTVLSFIKDKPNSEQYRWLYQFLAVDIFLEDFGLSLQEKLDLMTFLDKGRRRQHMNQQISYKFRELKEKIYNCLLEKDEDDVIKQITHVLKSKSETNRRVILELKKNYVSRNSEKDIYYLISNCIHMMVNRVCISRPNDHETLIYDFLLKYYTFLIKSNTRKT